MSTEKEGIYYEILVRRCQRREPEAFEELVRTWEKRLFFYVRRLAADEQDAWDILQETWLKVIRGIRSLREPRSLPTWLYRIARNTAMSCLRTHYTDRTLVDHFEEDSLASSEGCRHDFNFEDAEQVHWGLNRISLPHREILTLFFLEGFSLEELSAILQIPLGTVKSRLYYAKHALRDALERGEADGE